MEGRLTGTSGERLATDYAAGVLRGLGLDVRFEEFEFTGDVSLGDGNRFAGMEPGKHWMPLAFSLSGPVDAAPIVFAGNGIVAPDHDAYVHLEVKGRWVLILADHPPELNRHASLQQRALEAQKRGAHGLIVADVAPVRLRAGPTLATMSLPVVSITNEMADTLLLVDGRSTRDLADVKMGFEIPGMTVEANIALTYEKRTGRSVIARIDTPAETSVVIGAHIDHLGRGVSGSSLARKDEEGKIHYGADDNASGSAGVLEIAEWLATKKSGLKHDVVFALWSGEEIGLIGSARYPADGVVACFNMDMIGRMKGNVVLQGTGSSPAWRALIERVNLRIGVPVRIQDDPYVPTDATSFYVRNVPILSAFTGAHEDYHSPRDTVDKVKFAPMQGIVKLMSRLAFEVARGAVTPEYREFKAPESRTARLGRASLGTIPDYAAGEVKGVKLTGVRKGKPADRAGVRGGDVIVELAGRKIENIYDYTAAIGALKVGEEVRIVVLRDGERVPLRITPEARP